MCVPTNQLCNIAPVIFFVGFILFVLFVDAFIAIWRFLRTQRLTTSFHFCPIFPVDGFPSSPIQCEYVYVCVFKCVIVLEYFILWREQRELLRSPSCSLHVHLYSISWICFFICSAKSHIIVYFPLRFGYIISSHRHIFGRHMKAKTQIECKHKNICRLIFVERANVTSNLQMSLTAPILLQCISYFEILVITFSWHWHLSMLFGIFGPFHLGCGCIFRFIRLLCQQSN